MHRAALLLFGVAATEAARIAEGAAARFLKARESNRIGERRFACHFCAQEAEKRSVRFAFFLLFISKCVLIWRGFEATVRANIKRGAHARDAKTHTSRRRRRRLTLAAPQQAADDRERARCPASRRATAKARCDRQRRLLNKSIGCFA